MLEVSSDRRTGGQVIHDELEFPLAEVLAIAMPMNRTEPGQTSGETSRGQRPWDAVRSSKVRRARQLLKDPAYPSKKTLEAVAEVLARGLTDKKGSRPTEPPTG